MPQLDQVTFISQFFWLCVFFFGFYFVISKDFLPKMGRIFKFRKKKIALSSGGVQSLQQESEKVRASKQAVVENGLSAGHRLLITHLQRMESWVNGVITNTNKKELQNSNTLYVQWIGDHAIRQQVALQGAAFPSTPRIFLSILAEKCKKKRQDGKSNTAAVPSYATLSGDSLDQPLAERTKRSSSAQASKTKSARK